MRTGKFFGLAAFRLGLFDKLRAFLFCQRTMRHLGNVGKSVGSEQRLAIRAVSATALFSFPHVPLVRILHHDPPLGSQAPFSDIAEIW